MAGLTEFEKTERRGGGHDPKSKRVGLNGGRKARTYHANFGSCIAGTGGAKSALDYATREGDFSERDDLEHVAGDRNEVERAAEQIEETARLKRGRTAERIVVKLVAELPIDSTQDARRATAEAVVAHWRGRGYAAIAAIHTRGEDGQEQPHLHVVIAARPVAADGTVDRSVRLMVGKAAVQAERRTLAELINRHARSEVLFFGGRDQQMEQPGIVGRAPKKRVPERAWHVQGQRERDDKAVGQAHDRGVAAHMQAEEARRREEVERSARLARRADRNGLVVANSSEMSEMKKKAALADALEHDLVGFKTATATQARLIVAIAAEAGVTVTQEHLIQLDGGDLMGAVRTAKKRDIEGFQRKLAEAEARAERLAEELKQTDALAGKLMDKSDELEARLSAVGSSKMALDRVALALIGRPETAHQALWAIRQVYQAAELEPPDGLIERERQARGRNGTSR